MNQTVLPNADEALTDPAGYQNKLAAYFAAQTQAQIASVAAPVAQQLADTAESLSKMDPKNKGIWDKYGSEVKQAVANIPSHLRTQALYDETCTLIRGRHFADLAAEQAATLAAANPGVERGGSGASNDDAETAGSKDVWDKIAATAIGKATLDSIGKRGIMNAVNKGIYPSLEKYAEAVGKSKSRTEAKQSQVIRG